MTAPASTETRDGLGPLLNAQSCSSCHIRDGRGAADGEQPGLLVRIGIIHDGAAESDPVYGDQIQDRAILGVDRRHRSEPSTPRRPGPIQTGRPISCDARSTSWTTSPMATCR